MARTAKREKVKQFMEKYSKKLENLDVRELKDRIQWVQKGNEENARKFLQSLDDGLTR